MVPIPPKTPSLGLASFNREFSFRHGQAHKILANHNDDTLTPLLRRFGEFSEDEVDVFRELLRPSAVVVEVGANIGAHTLALAGIVPEGLVAAFEPQRLTFQTLCANLALNSITNVKAYEVAVGAKAGFCSISTPDPMVEQNFGCYPINAGGFGEWGKLVALDDLGYTRCDLIKIDCEGSEVEVLKGAAATIERHHPWIYLEFDSHRQELMDLLTSMDYSFARHLPRHSRYPNYAGVPVDEMIFASDMVLAWHNDQPLSPEMASGEFTFRHQFFPATTDQLLVLGNKACND